MEPLETDLSESRRLHVAYVGPIDFPSSSAPAQRMMGIVQALNAAGDRVRVGSAGHDKHGPAVIHGSQLDVTRLGELPDPEWSKLRRILRGLTWGAATRSWIRKMDPAPDMILVYGTALGYLGRLIPLSRRLGIPLVIDATEWYESTHLPGGRWGPFAMANGLSMRGVAPTADGVIAISSFLEDYFTGRGVPTLRVPPLFVVGEDAVKVDVKDEPLTLCYVGSPGLKDRQTLMNLIHLPAQLRVASDRLRIDIVGVDKAAASVLLGDIATSVIQNECLFFHGRLSSAEARKVIANSQFSVLQRGNERYAQAGYPSKIPESLLLGTPVMANLTSDLADILEDGKNSQILADASLESLTAKVSEMLGGPYQFDRDAIAAQARIAFSPTAYAQSIHDFLADRKTIRAFQGD